MKILENREQWYTDFRDGWLKHYEQTGTIDWKLYRGCKNYGTISGPGTDLTASRLMFISTAGGYLPDSQPPFDAANPLGDYSLRLFPASTLLDALAFAHDHYDHTAVEQDPQVLVPLRHLDDLVSEGVIGEIAPTVVSFMGYQPDVTRVIDEMIPPILEIAQKEQATAALLVPA